MTRQTLADSIVYALTDEIISKRLLPGCELDEGRLAQRFGASRTPVREALRQLAASGLVGLRPHRAPLVAKLDPGLVGEMFEAMAELEALPSIFTGLRLGLGLAWFVIVVGEMTGVPQGLGAVIMDGRTLSRTELVICGMMIIGAAGYVSDRIVLGIGNRMLRWSPNHHG